MKTMTCKQMGGPCDTAMTAESADDMMGLGVAHLTEMKDKDADHKAAFDMMADAQTNPAAGDAWYKKFKADFDAAPAN